MIQLVVCSVWLPRERIKGCHSHESPWLAAPTRGGSCSEVGIYLFSCTSFWYSNRKRNLFYLHTVLGVVEEKKPEQSSEAFCRCEDRFNLILTERAD